MLQTRSRLGFALLLLLIAACGQEPAQVVLKGQNTYGRNGTSSYAANNPNSPQLYSYVSPAASAPTYTVASAATTQTAGIQGVGVHDLAAMAPAAGQPTFNTPMRTSPPAPQKQPVAQLDSIIGNDGSSKAHPVKSESVAFMWPVSGKQVISTFGPKGDGKVNDGINIAAKEGEPVWASADGEVVYVGNELAGYGNMVLIKHSGNKTTAYAHLERMVVDKYDRVKQGDIIGYVGTTGNVKEPQLHFAIRDGKDPVDPARYLSRSVASK